MIDCGNAKYDHPFHAAKVPYFKKTKKFKKCKEGMP